MTEGLCRITQHQMHACAHTCACMRARVCSCVSMSCAAQQLHLPGVWSVLRIA